MSYIRTKNIKGNTYSYEQESYRENGKVKTRHIKYIGNDTDYRLSNTTRKETHTEKINILNKKAINFFGLTENENEAGYILQDGKMLDFSGRYNAVGYENKKPKNNEPDYLKNQRSIDHREINSILNDKKRETRYDSIKEYGEETGSIRLTKATYDKDINVEFFKKPTFQQLTRLKSIQYKNRGKIYADLTYKKDFKGTEKSVYGGETKEYSSVEALEKDL